MGVVIAGSGVFTPDQRISNEELVEAYNEYARRENARFADEIEAGSRRALELSSAEFIEQASGIRSRYVVDREGILDPEVMSPRLPSRSREEPSLLCEIAEAAARQALAQAQRAPESVDCVIVACSNLERAYPAIAVELQRQLGCGGFAFDMNVACGSAVFAAHVALHLLRAGGARRVLVANPEVCSGHLNFRDRDCHFIFGDAAAALVYERDEDCAAPEAWEVVDSRVATQFSNHIRNDFGFLGRLRPEPERELLFTQEGRKVFKEVVPWVASMIEEQLSELDVKPETVRRYWLHQANSNMNRLVLRRLLGHEPEPGRGPIILDEYANTSSAGAVIAFHEHRADLRAGDLGVLSAFGAGYSAGSLLLRRR